MTSLDVDANPLQKLPDTAGMDRLKVLSVKSISLAELPTTDSLPRTLNTLSVDGNVLPGVPVWVYDRVERNGLTFSMWPQCLRGWVKPDGASQCQKLMECLPPPSLQAGTKASTGSLAHPLPSLAGWTVTVLLCLSFLGDSRV